jgi:hypothetical protein
LRSAKKPFKTICPLIFIKESSIKRIKEQKTEASNFD